MSIAVLLLHCVEKGQKCLCWWCRDLFEGSSELRLLLCREQTNNGRRSVHVVCACGIFVQHILDAVPIDKYFEMFKPGSGSDGGFVRLKMRLMSNSDMKKEKGTNLSAHSMHACNCLLPSHIEV